MGYTVYSMVATTQKNIMDNKKEAGNVLFLILIAVALFGALAYVVTKGSRSGVGNVNKEKYGLNVSQLTQYPLAVRAAVLRLSTTTGKGSENVSFDWPGWGNTAYQHAVPVEDENKVFHPKGAGVPFQKPDTQKMLDQNQSSQPGWGQWLFTGTTCIPGLGTGDDATCNSSPTQMDLIAILPYVKKELCEAANMTMKINVGTGGTPPVDQGDAWRAANPEFDGTYTTGEALIDAGNVLYGKDAGCFEGGGGTPPTGTYHFFMSLVHR
jgi:hypothetical protein